MFDFENWYDYFLYKVSLHTLAYFITALFVFTLFKKLHTKNLIVKIQKTLDDKKIIKSEIKWSAINIIISAFLNVSIFLAYKQGYTKIYLDFNTYGYPYLFLSPLVLLLIHDFYFYWSHRLLHKKWWYEKIHIVHHQSINPSAWTIFSHHPVEVFILFGFIPLSIFLIPLHPLVILLFGTYFYISNLVAHTGYELFPKWFAKSWLGKIFLTSTYHNMHHEYGAKNYGLYFFFWDRLMNTYNKDYYKKFEEVKSQRE